MELGLPHPMHLHCNNLGVPGNFQTTLDTMRAMEGLRAHVTHIQFHSYGGDPDNQSTFHSRVPELADYVNSHPNLTVDVGQVMFGDTASMTGDGPLGYFLHKVYGRKWFSGDTEMEAGCGIVPITYKDKSRVHALQWAIGLEWYLLKNDERSVRIAMSTDHPNGDRSFSPIRRSSHCSWTARAAKRCWPSCLRRPRRVRAGGFAARVHAQRDRHHHAGLPRPHAGPPPQGASGCRSRRRRDDLHPGEDKQRMFELPRVVIHRGRVVFEEGDLRQAEGGVLLHSARRTTPRPSTTSATGSRSTTRFSFRITRSTTTTSESTNWCR